MTASAPPPHLDLAQLAGRLAARKRDGQLLIIGMTGSVAVGKTTLGEALVGHLSGRYRVESLSTDGFILPNARLAEMGLSLRKGFPESYDVARMEQALTDIRTGPATFPGYSHMTYDADPARDRRIDPPDILLLEGLGFAPPAQTARRLDLLIYLDAAEDLLEAWFLERFLRFWRAAETDPASFYVQFRTMTEAEAILFARSVWTGINLPNLRDHIIKARDLADIVLAKTPDHQLTLVRALDAPGP